MKPRKTGEFKRWPREEFVAFALPGGTRKTLSY
jgi:hypothetical protein